MLALIKKTCTNVADVHGCRVEFEPYTKVLMEPVINDQEVVEETAQKLTQMCGPQVLGEHGLWFASETFCKYLNKYPGALGFWELQIQIWDLAQPIITAVLMWMNRHYC